ncbi:hypothetical protein TIFTF001_024373 [Ficus carica]|uniref:Uncharacterized protein n=1 Tax=Ficus carica TaxID=3494 RepID=A0AA88AGJ5_FICCA|nr:hypothetical protein TIFTF001_024373 [Ficus carica]
MPIRSPAKKRKANEKPKRKVPAKRKKASKASTSETDAELRKSKQDDQSIEVNLPPEASLLQNRDLGVGIMRQLLSDVDLDTINGGRIQNHLDELLWDGLKIRLLNLCSNLQAMGLIFRTSNKVVEQKNRVKELEDKDHERGEKLLNIK